MATEIITREDLTAFKQELLDDIKALLNLQPETKQWLKSQDVRKMLSISPGTLQTLRIKGTLKFSKVGGTLFYKLEDVERLLNNSRVSG